MALAVRTSDQGSPAADDGKMDRGSHAADDDNLMDRGSPAAQDENKTDSRRPEKSHQDAMDPNQQMQEHQTETDDLDQVYWGAEESVSNAPVFPRKQRVRTLTQKGLELFETTKQKFSDKLINHVRNLQRIMSEFAKIEDVNECVSKRYELTTLYALYECENTRYLQFLSQANTADSLGQIESQVIIFRTVSQDVYKAIDKKDGPERALQASWWHFSVIEKIGR